MKRIDDLLLRSPFLREWFASGRLTFTTTEIAKLLGTSEQNARAAIQDGTIPSLTIGEKRIVVPAASFLKLVGIDFEPNGTKKT